MSFTADRSVRPDDCTALTSLWQPPFSDAPELERLRCLPRPVGALGPAAIETEGTLEAEPQDR